MSTEDKPKVFLALSIEELPTPQFADLDSARVAAENWKAQMPDKEFLVFGVVPDE